MNIFLIRHGQKMEDDKNHESLICGLLNIDQSRRFYLGNPPENCSISMIK